MWTHTHDVAEAFLRAVQLLFFRPVARYAADPSRLALAVLVLLSFVTTVLMQVAEAGADFEFNAVGFAWIVTGWAAFLGLLWLLRPRAARFGFGRLVADYTAIGILTGLVWIAADELGSRFEALAPLREAASGWLLFGLAWLFVVWWLVAAWRAGYVTWTGSDRRYGGRAAVLGFLLAFVIPCTPMISGRDTQPVSFDVWQIAGAYWSFYSGTGIDRLPDAEPVDVEAVYYAQPELVGSALAGVQRSNPNVAEIYFLGAAADAGQDVFKSEASKTRDLFDERFGTKGRSLLLANHPSTVTDLPLANVSNLDALLAGLATKMDTENDVLALFLTSHGSPGNFSISFPGFSLNDLTPERLAEVLDRSGIQNRVLVISACFSGSFIPALKNDHTLIMTAASAERTSFGCSNEREWTYFGDAYFNRALRATHSFEDGFNTAKATIGGWERTQKLTPSDPQISMGRAIKPRLDALARDLAKLAPAAQGLNASARDPSPAPRVEAKAE